MKLKVQYYGLLTDITKCDTEMIDIGGKTNSTVFMTCLHKKYPDFKKHSIVYFANGKKLTQGDKIPVGSEIDCMPPFAGG